MTGAPIPFGGMKQSGVEVWGGEDRITIFPVTSKGVAGRGMIQIPMEHAKAVANALIELSRLKQSEIPFEGEEEEDPSLAIQHMEDQEYEHPTL